MRETKLESWLASNQGDWDEKEYNKIDTKKKEWLVNFVIREDYMGEKDVTSCISFKIYGMRDPEYLHFCGIWHILVILKLIKPTTVI